MKHLTRVIGLLLLSSTVNSQIVSYNDVGVIVNDNSQTSIDIANYFQQQRNIPNQNIIHINAPTSEEIDSLQFEQIRAQVESYLTSNGLADSLNYLVTTKGVPLKTQRTNCDYYPSLSNCASFEAEIGLILGPYSNEIGAPGSMAFNPYYNSSEHFLRDSVGFYLVTRLDAYSKQDVLAMIDQSGPNTGINKSTAQAILDVSGYSAPTQYPFINYYQPSYDTLINDGWNTIFDTNSTLLTNQSNVFSYAGAIGQPAGVDLNFGWTNGSFTSLFYCSAYTFEPAMNTANDFLVGDIIAEGATASHGFVYAAWDAFGLRTHILFDRYLDTINNFNLAESYWMAVQTLAWSDVVIGDPKANVIIDNTASLGKNELTDISIYPNPNSGLLTIEGDGIDEISIYDMQGILVHESKWQSNKVSLNLSELSQGVYVVTVASRLGTCRSRLVMSK